MKKIITLIILVCIQFSLVYAIGITPAKGAITLYPGETQEYEFTAFSNEPFPQIAALVFIPWRAPDEAPDIYKKEDKLAKYITLDKTEIPLEPTEQQQFKLKAVYPQEDLEPGNYEFALFVTQGKPKGSSGIVALGAVRAPFNVWLKKKGKYIHANIPPINAKENQPTPFMLNMRSWGDEVITQAKASIEIYSTNNLAAKISTVDMGFTSLEKDESKTLNGVWTPPQGTKGAYFIKAIIDYDGNTAYANRTIKIGSLNLKITDITSQADIGGVTPFYLTIENDWPSPLENLFADITIKKEGNTVASMTASEKTISGLGKTKMKTYLDATSLQQGVYTVDVSLSFSDGTQKYTTKADGTLKLLAKETISPTTPAKEEPSQEVSAPKSTSEPKSSSGRYIIRIISAIAILGLITLLIFIRRKR